MKYSGWKVFIEIKLKVLLTGIARLIHVSDLDLTSEILIFDHMLDPLHDLVYATKQFGYPPPATVYVFCEYTKI